MERDKIEAPIGRRDIRYFTGYVFQTKTEVFSIADQQLGPASSGAFHSSPLRFLFRSNIG